MHPIAHPPLASPATLMYAPVGALKGRGTVWALEHRFSTDQRSEFDDGWGTLERAAGAEPATPLTQVSEESVRRILSGNDSPDIGFDLSINPYRGCEHGCIYCYARPTHSYLNLSPGLDFETRIIAKPNLAQVLSRELQTPGYLPRQIVIGSATDAYQPAEREWKITRAVLAQHLGQALGLRGVAVNAGHLGPRGGSEGGLSSRVELALLRVGGLAAREHPNELLDPVGMA